nr:hypothetical protein [uncultured Duganella sp.]
MTIVRYLLAAALAIAISGCTTPQEPHMKQSVTYLHLLKKTPFFTRLDKDQLRWVIAHSTEWEAQAGMEVSNRLDANDHIWILLDGGWQVEQGGQVLKAGHADAAKWYGGQHVALLPPDSRLIANQHSYVMRIARADFEEMLKRRFDFTAHLQQGEAFYGQH